MSKIYLKSIKTAFAAVALTFLFGGTVKATKYYPTSVTELNTYITNAVDYDTIYLDPTYSYTNSASTTYTVSSKIVKIMAISGATSKPVITNTFFKIGNGTLTDTSGIYFKGIELNGGSISANFILFGAGSATYPSRVKLENCSLHNATRSAILSSSSYIIDTVYVNNCIFYAVGGGSADTYPAIGTTSSSSCFLYTKVSNSTFYKISGPVFRLAYSGATYSQNATFDHCTIDSVYSATSPFYLKTNTATANSFNITNTLLTCFKGLTSIYARVGFGTSVSNISTSRFFHVFTSDTTTSSYITIASTYLRADPNYTDSINHNYTVNNSSLLTAASDGTIIGDPRWTPTITKVSSVADAGIKVYPNPVVDNLTIVSEKQSVVDIYNVLGAKISTNTVDANANLNVSDLKSGVYIVKVQSGGETKTVQIIKK